MLATLRLPVVLGACFMAACGTSHPVADVDAGIGDSGSTPSDAGRLDAGSVDGGQAVTVDPGWTYSSVSCDPERGMTLMVEIWNEAKGECVPDPGAIDVLVLGVDRWDGRSGVFEVGVSTPRGRAGASRSGGSVDVTGTIVIEPFDDTPRFVAWDLSIDEGRADLSRCGRFEAYPCEP
jgi:hypothetical protein